jgi:hypothetical protein
LVRFLRFAIPVGIVAIIAIMVVATFFNPSRLFAGSPIDPSKISLSGTKVVMELPRVSGFTSDSQPYEVTARTATQDLTKPDILEPRDISGLVELKDGQRVTIGTIGGNAQYGERRHRFRKFRGGEASRQPANQGQSSGSDGESSLDPLWRRRRDDPQSGLAAAGFAGRAVKCSGASFGSASAIPFFGAGAGRW